MQLKEETVDILITNYLGKRDTQQSIISSVSPDSKQTQKSTVKYLWKRLKGEFKKCIEKHNIRDPVTEEGLWTILTRLGYISKNQDIKANAKLTEIKGNWMPKNELVEIMNILKVSRTSEVGESENNSYEDEVVTTVDKIKSFLLYLWTPNQINKK